MYQHYENPQFSSPSPSPSQSSSPCLQGHRTSLTLTTQQGGSICLLCFSNLISNPNSPKFHVSYALSQLSHAISQPQFLNRLLSFHVHLILSPLANSLSSFDDDQIAEQVTDVVSKLSDDGGSEIAGDFVARIADLLSSTALAWSHRQFYSLHCLGVLLTQHEDTYACIKDKAVLIYNLVVGLQLPSEEIRGEIMFVLYRICILQLCNKDEEGANVLLKYCPTLLRLCLDALMKTQRHDVRLNCIALLEVLGQRGFLSNAFLSDFNKMDINEADDEMQTTDAETNDTPLSRLFAEAIKSPLLSLDIKVQTSTLDFISHCLSRGDCSATQIEILVEENVADYIFEILRLSEHKDQIIISCVQVLDLLSTAEQAFKQRLAIGFTSLIPVLPQVAQVPFHPVQTQMLKLIFNGISSFPGVVSTKLVEEISTALASMLKRHTAGEMGMLSETFITVCSIFAALMKSPSASGASTLMSMVQEASRNAILASLGIYDQDQNQLLHSLYLLKEAYDFSQQVNSKNSGCDTQMRNSIMEVCHEHILPWFVAGIDNMEEESILGILEVLHFLLSLGLDNQVLELTQSLLSVSWFHLSFKCLGLYPTEKMKLRVYVTMSSIVDNIIGGDSGQSIRASASALPADPIDLLFLLGQKSTNNLQLSSCQVAVLEILYISSLYNEMMADKKLVLTSLEQYILANSSNFLYGTANPIAIAQLLSLYGLFRGFAELSFKSCYSSEAENIFFEIVSERDWDLSSLDIHPLSLDWLFQQERISKTLSWQILKLCRKSFSNGTKMNGQVLNFQHVAQLAAEGNSLMPKLLVSLLKQLMVDDEMVVDDVISLLHFLSSIIYIFPDASYQLCLHGMGNAVQSLCSNLLFPSSLKNYVIISRFVFIILSSVDAQPLHDDEAWLAVIMKLLDAFTTTANGWAEEHLLVIGVLSLVLHHSTQGALVETSKFILLNTSLASLIRATVHELSTNGFASVEQEEGTDTEQALVFLLLLYYFYLRSLQAVLPGSVDSQNFLKLPEATRMHPSMGILCQDVCRFLHFGSPLVKLVASYCLVELLTSITVQHNRQQKDLECTLGYLRSMTAVLEGLALDCDLRIAINSCLCLSMILSWEIPGAPHTNLVSDWCRVIVEELAMSLTAPCSVSKSSTNHHKASIHIATALLRSKTVPAWMKSVFDEACVCGIIEKLSPNNIGVEVVFLCQELLQSAFLKPDQIASLSHLLQACKKRLCMENNEAESMGQQQTRKTITMVGDLGEVCEFLLHLMSSESHPDLSSGGSHVRNDRLSEEIDLFFQLLAENEET